MNGVLCDFPRSGLSFKVGLGLTCETVEGISFMKWGGRKKKQSLLELHSEALQTEHHLILPIYIMYLKNTTIECIKRVIR